MSAKLEKKIELTDEISRLIHDARTQYKMSMNLTGTSREDIAERYLMEARDLLEILLFKS